MVDSEEIFFNPLFWTFVFYNFYCDKYSINLKINAWLFYLFYAYTYKYLYLLNLKDNRDNHPFIICIKIYIIVIL